jgi:hypothetical protein
MLVGLGKGWCDGGMVADLLIGWLQMRMMCARVIMRPHMHVDALAWIQWERVAIFSAPLHSTNPYLLRHTTIRHGALQCMTYLPRSRSLAHPWPEVTTCSGTTNRRDKQTGPTTSHHNQVSQNPTRSTQPITSNHTLRISLLTTHRLTIYLVLVRCSPRIAFVFWFAYRLFFLLSLAGNIIHFTIDHHFHDTPRSF